MLISQWARDTLAATGVAIIAIAVGTMPAMAKPKKAITFPSAAALSIAGKSRPSTGLVGTGSSSDTQNKKRSLGDKHSRRHGGRPDLDEDHKHGDGHDAGDHHDGDDDHPKSP